MVFAARRHSDSALEAATPTADLARADDRRTWLDVDHLVRGFGTGSCGPDTLPVYPHRFWSLHVGLDPDCLVKTAGSEVRT